MNGQLIKAAIVVAVLAGAVLCSIGAYDHDLARAPASPASEKALASAARGGACAPGPGGRIECAEEILVVGHRSTRSPLPKVACRTSSQSLLVMH